jgi:beta-galactosidase
MMKSAGLLLVLVLVFGQSPVWAQTILYTPDAELNRHLVGQSIGDVDLFGVSVDPEGQPVINPNLHELGWRWLAGREVEYEGRTMSFFVFDGYIYSTVRPQGKYRPIVGDEDVSGEVTSNAFHIALRKRMDPPRGKDDEYFLIVASDSAKQVRVTLGASLLGHDETMDLDLEAGEARFFRIVDTRPMPERRPLYAPASSSPRSSIELSRGWRFFKGDVADAEQTGFDDSEWSFVTVPHSWNTTDIFDNRNVYSSADIYSDYWRGTGWYRLMLDLPIELAPDQRLLLSFDGANQVSEVWVNAIPVGKHVGGYTGFAFDITDTIGAGEPATIAVKVDNSYNYDILPHIADFNMTGGITREVRLQIVPDLRVMKTFVTTPQVSRQAAAVDVQVTVGNDRDHPATARILSSIVDPQGFVVSSLESDVVIAAKSSETIRQLTERIDHPQLWSPDHPSVYRVVTHVFEKDRLVDLFESPLGFRWFDFDPSAGFFLNGDRLQLRGANLHQDRFGFGPAVPDWLRVQDLEMMKDMGANFVRLAHYPHDPVMLEAADVLGLLVWAEIPFVNTVGREAFIENAKTMLREMIRRDRNHPSIVFWGIANETHSEWLTEEELIYVERALRELNDTVHEEDPTRYSAQAQNAIADTTIIGITDVIGRNRYFGWYSEGIENFGKVMDTEHAAHPDWRILITEYGAGAKRGYHVEDPHRFDFSESYQVEFHEGILDQIEARPYLAGGSIWNMFDFASQNKIGSIPRINQKGMGTYDRIPKDAFYFYKSRWSDEPTVYIVSHTWDRRSGPARESRPVRVFSNMDEVSLHVNGTSIGKRDEDFIWDVFFHEGRNRLKAVGRDTLTGRTVVDEVEIYYESEDSER